jgi:hypothetical protein
MKKIFFIGCFIFSSIAFSQTSLDFFQNISYRNPAFYNKPKLQFDLNSTSLFNKIPLGMYGLGMNLQKNSSEKIGGAVGFQNTLIGKNQKQTQANLFLNYGLPLNFTYHLHLGLGFQFKNSTIDEQLLTKSIDTDNFSYTYGTGIEKQTSFLIPLGVNFHSEKIDFGAYYGQGIQTESNYGTYLQIESIKTKIKTFDLVNKTGFAFLKHQLNPQISVSNQSQLDNYQIDFFANYQLSSSLKNTFSFGAGLHYHWKTFDINYRSSINNQGLGMSHQIGIQVFKI